MEAEQPIPCDDLRPDSTNPAISSPAPQSGLAISPFTAGVVRLSKRYPDLQELARFLTHNFRPGEACIPWSRSTNVDVIVVDIMRPPAKSIQRHVRCIEQLESITKEDLCDIVLRTYLVEDMTAPVVERLGHAYSCHPHFFSAHMETMGDVDRHWIDEAGRVRDQASGYHSRPVSAVARSHTELANLPYFSLSVFREYEPADPLGRHNGTWTNGSMYRLCDDGLWEERVTGMLCSSGGGTSNVAICLFDPNQGPLAHLNSKAQPFRPVLEECPRIPLPSASLENEARHIYSTRDSLLEELESDPFKDAVIEDPSLLLSAILSSMLDAWLSRVRDMDKTCGLRTLDVNRLSWRNNTLSLGYLIEKHQRVQRHLEMLTVAHNISEARGCGSMRTKTGTQADKAMARLAIDYGILMTRTKTNLEMLERRVTTIAAMRSIQESEKAVEQSRRMGSLTSLASFYIPLTFVATLLGMNVDGISSGDLPLWIYFVISIPLSVITVWVLAYWDQFQAFLNYLFEQVDPIANLDWTRRKRRSR